MAKKKKGRKRKRSSNTSASERALSRKTSPGWATTDTDEIEVRQQRAQAESMQIANMDRTERFFSTFSVRSGTSGMEYSVEIRSLTKPENSCTCPDFRINGLGTCKHIEAVLNHLRRRPRLFKRAAGNGSPKTEIYLRRQGDPVVCLQLPRRPGRGVRSLADRFFSASGELLGAPETAVPALRRAVDKLGPKTRRRVRVSSEVQGWVEHCTSKRRQQAARAAFEKDLRSGKRTIDVVNRPLYSYQIEGMLHLAFRERAMLVDDMGLGKTVQAIAACALLKELRGIERVLVICPASLKTEWEEQIQKFTTLPFQLMYGLKHIRVRRYRQAPFFSITNYEQILRDVWEINQYLAPDVIILDEAQRIKNWSTKTAQAVKRLQSPYAFVLTGTPLENRIDEIYSITEFLDPHLFGPLFRFNRDFYVLNDYGRPQGYKNLGELRRRIRPVMLRRRKDEVEDQLPERVDNNYFVEMTPQQLGPYKEYESTVAALVEVAKKRALTKEEQDKLMIYLGCMRMLCDSKYILDKETKISPKIRELENVLLDAGVHNGSKAVIFSEWKLMLDLARDLAEEMKLGYAWHVGEVPQKKRRREINRFKNEEECKLFMSTDSGGLGLNLQAANVVINLDLPWNPAKLEQRIARAWRKYQKKPVNVINLVSEDTIEHKMLATLNIKKELAEGIVDGRGDPAELKMPSSREAFLERLKVIMGARPAEGAKPRRRRPAAKKKREAPPREQFREGVLAELAGRVQLIEIQQEPGTEGESALVVVDREPDQTRAIIKRHFCQAYDKKDSEEVEVLDKQTYETILRLAERGLVTMPGKKREEVHRSSSLKQSGPSPEERRRKEAEKLSKEADRKLRMSRVLSDGGFPCDAIPPLFDAVELILRALAVLAGKDSGGEEQGPLPAKVIHGDLVAAGLLAPDDAAQVSSLRELAGDKTDLNETTAKRLLKAGEEIVAKGCTSVTKQELKV